MTTVYTILGMHKSGTTLLSQMLDASGIGMIEGVDSRSYDQGNHFERLSTNGLNKRLLGCGEANSLRVITPYAAGPDHADRIAEARALASEIAAPGGDWGFKDPRSCLTHAFWAEALPDLRVICVYRSAASVRRHYTARKHLSVSRGARALRAWYLYNHGMLAAYDSTAPARRILLNYETLLTDDAELRRLQAFVGRPLQDSRRPALNRRSSAIGLRERIERAALRGFAGLDITALESRLAAALAAERG
ncbi:sulfotransferase family protein [Paragemmobacter straminiformis]|uniref:Sulfotransferase n=1 Tax=Paragemmobacter straminiformis TaxID=2045119 RepID=A0A842I9R2_9RHOB|nr:sulfotransferase [Gemmobacter straminiformis]MBC2836153.1 sulfotransferase [Gemmobacter straminiformis]